MAIVFTCTKCDTRSAKTFSRQSYENGIVLIRCPGCKNLHLVADNLGWFGEDKFKIEDLASEVGASASRSALGAPHALLASRHPCCFVC
jgi:mitochondrial protein import protein ZIM17